MLSWPKNSFRFFHNVAEKPEWTFWPTFYFACCHSAPSLLMECLASVTSLVWGHHAPDSDRCVLSFCEVAFSQSDSWGKFFSSLQARCRSGEFVPRIPSKQGGWLFPPQGLTEWVCSATVGIGSWDTHSCHLEQGRMLSPYRLSLCLLLRNL